MKIRSSLFTACRNSALNSGFPRRKTCLKHSGIPTWVKNTFIWPEPMERGHGGLHGLRAQGGGSYRGPVHFSTPGAVYGTLPYKRERDDPEEAHGLIQEMTSSLFHGGNILQARLKEGGTLKMREVISRINPWASSGVISVPLIRKRSVNRTRCGEGQPHGKTRLPEHGSHEGRRGPLSIGSGQMNVFSTHVRIPERFKQVFRLGKPEFNAEFLQAVKRLDRIFISGVVFQGFASFQSKEVVPSACIFPGTCPFVNPKGAYYETLLQRAGILMWVGFRNNIPDF